MSIFCLVKLSIAAQHPVLARLGERDRGAFAAGAAGAADAVHVGLGRRRHVVVEDVRELLDVEAARGDVGGNQQVGLAGAEHLHHAVALPLFHAAVERLRAAAVRVERLDQRLDLEPRAAEDDRRRRVLHVEHAIERRRLVRARHDVGDLADARHLAGGGLLARDDHPRRVVQMALRNRQDPRRHRRREQRRLPRLRRRLENRVEILGEAHVEHLVGLVEDQHAQGAELQRAALDVIERAPRRGDDDAGAALEGANLLRDRRAAVDRQHGDAESLRVLVDRFRHLHRQLARRHEHQPAGLFLQPLVFAPAAAASAARTPPSCRCRSPPGRARRVPRAAAESFRAAPASVLRSRARLTASASGSIKPSLPNPSCCRSVKVSLTSSRSSRRRGRCAARCC